MATPAPLFHVYDALKAALRLSGAGRGSDFDAVFDNAVIASQAAFWARLDGARVAYLKGLPDTPNPATDDEFLRQLAGVTEIAMVRLKLLEAGAQTFFKDGGGAAFDAAQDEGGFRGTGAFQAEKIKSALRTQIDEAMVRLAGDAEAGEPASGAVADLGPSCGPAILGERIFGSGGIFRG